MGARRWTLSELEWVEKNANTMTIYEMAETINRESSAIAACLSKNYLWRYNNKAAKEEKEAEIKIMDMQIISNLIDDNKKNLALGILKHVQKINPSFKVEDFNCNQCRTNAKYY